MNTLATYTSTHKHTRMSCLTLMPSNPSMKIRTHSFSNDRFSNDLDHNFNYNTDILPTGIETVKQAT